MLERRVVGKRLLVSVHFNFQRLLADAQYLHLVVPEAAGHSWNRIAQHVRGQHVLQIHSKCHLPKLTNQSLTHSTYILVLELGVVVPVGCF